MAAEKKVKKETKEKKAVKETKKAGKTPVKEKKDDKKTEKVKQLSAKETTSSEVKGKFYSIVKHPLISEKAVGMIETQNKLTFVIEKGFTKSEVKRAVEQMYNVKVDRVQVVNDMKGRKKAIVRINKQYRADEIATKLGIL
ncbi:MAG: 50S ribosomal protein L23 [Candidatus Diapherotrites archaeon]